MTKNTLPAPAALKADAKSQFKALARELDQDSLKALAPARVHGARRRIKRLRSLLRLLREGLGESAYAEANAQLRDAADGLAQQRRADALLAAAQRLGTRKQPHALQAVAEAHRRDHAGGSSAPDGLKAARKAVTAATKAVSASRLKRRLPETVATGFTGFYRKARKDLGKALETQEPEALHEARKKVIDHLHHLELLKPHLPGLDGKRLTRLDGLREALGDLNDLDELQQLAAARDLTLDGKDAKVLEKRRKRLLEEAARLFKLLFRDKRKAFARHIGIGAAETGKRAKARSRPAQSSGAAAAQD